MDCFVKKRILGKKILEIENSRKKKILRKRKFMVMAALSVVLTVAKSIIAQLSKTQPGRRQFFFVTVKAVRGS